MAELKKYETFHDKKTKKKQNTNIYNLLHQVFDGIDDRDSYRTSIRDIAFLLLANESGSVNIKKENLLNYVIIGKIDTKKRKKKKKKIK